MSPLSYMQEIPVEDQQTTHHAHQPAHETPGAHLDKVIASNAEDAHVGVCCGDARLVRLWKVHAAAPCQFSLAVRQ